MAGVLKQIEIVEGKHPDRVQERVNDALGRLCDRGIDTDEIEVLCNITLFGDGYTYYTYTIIHEEC